ncbi:MAG: nuclear transport factor 2 family protein [Gemmatimonadaceae bacterium]
MTSLRMAHGFPLVCAFALAAGCTPASGERLSTAQTAAISDTLRRIVRNAYDLSKGDAVRRFMSVYPSSGRVVSAAGGRVSTTRDSLQMSINAFWDGVGQHMLTPTWTWGNMDVDVLSPTSAVMTAQYAVPHWTDRGVPHVIGGVWTSVWRRTSEGWRIVHEHLSDMPRPLAERMEATMPRRDSTAGHSH